MVQFKIPYGIDAPYVLRNLFLFSLLAAVGAALSCLVDSPFWFWLSFLCCGTLSLGLLITGCWRIYSSIFLKPLLAKNLIDGLDLRGNETLLDVGCGRGLLLIEAAKRLPKGEAHGVDVWSQKDQSGNGLDSVIANAKDSGTAERIKVQTADISHLPFPDAFFDAVVSNLALHHIPEEKNRFQALREILRVLKPGGKFALLDIQYTERYARFINYTNQAEATCSAPIYQYYPPIQTVYGEKKNTEIERLKSW